VGERIRILLDWKPDAKHALFSEGMARGAYAAAGIELHLVEPAAKSIEGLDLLSRGEVELSINYPHNLLLSAGQYPGLLSTGALVRRNPEGLLSLASNPVRAPADLAGKRVGIGPSPVSQAQFDVFCAANGLDRADLDVVVVGFDGEEQLLDGRIHALDAVAYAIARTERKGHAVRFVPYARFGIPDSPFLVFAARASWAGDHAGLLEAFFRVAAESFARVCAWGSREWKTYAAGIPGRDGDEEQAVWNATRPLIEGAGRLFGHDQAALAGLQDILVARGLLSGPADLPAVFTDRFLSAPPARET
jgi:ABC-type nitrate/sulfonate/bicarbonate transport system substrate-binding protein